MPFSGGGASGLSFLQQPGDNPAELRYDGRVALVTGAGNGLGKVYALMLAARGAKVVVNDLGGGAFGEGAAAAPADNVVAEIKAAGGEAVANYDSVEFGEKIVQTALDTWGRIDIIVNNAGILRDKSLRKMSEEDWTLIYKVHMRGCYTITKAAWPHMNTQKYGRVVNITSAAGLYGNFGQTNYSAMKMGIVGFSLASAREGASNGIRVNIVAPLAGSRLTETVMTPEHVAALKADYVAPVIGYLASEANDHNGGIFEVGAGWISQVRWQRSEGVLFDVSKKNFSIEDVGNVFPKINDFESNPNFPRDMTEGLKLALSNAQSKL